MAQSLAPPPPPLPDWSQLGFQLTPTRCNVRAVYRDGAWSDLEVSSDFHVSLHIGATVLHYGQAVFEGLKAFRGPDGQNAGHRAPAAPANGEWARECKTDGQIRLFRPLENARRMMRCAQRMEMPPVPIELFLKAVETVVRENADYCPPHGLNASLYVRPVLFGSGPQLGLKPADEYHFIVFVVPIGARDEPRCVDGQDRHPFPGGYYGNTVKAVPAMIVDDFDRSAPRGMGPYKAAGNYAPAILPNRLAGALGCPITLYLDAAEHKYVEEFNSSNFVGITADGVYVTPKSDAILPGITNASLMALAAHWGIPVEHRVVPATELPSFVEVGATGTAVVLTPIQRILWGKQVIDVSGGREDQSIGPVLSKLYHGLRAIQSGDAPDELGWMHAV